MNILNILFLVLGVTTILIGAVAYKKRTLIMEALYVRANAKLALKELEQNMYTSAYEEALKEELPKTMKEKAIRDVQKKYNRTPLVDKLAKMAANVSVLPRQNSGEYISIIDDLNIFNRNKSSHDKK